MSNINISIETIALRETNKRKHAEDDALVLQEELLKAHRKIKELEDFIEELSGGKENGNTT